MYNSNVELTVQIKGRPITEFSHRGQVFIEGRAGSEYTLRVKNKTADRIEAVISVDGLSITDGKAAGDKSSGYLLNAFEEIEIPGWKLDSQAAAKFAFSGKQNSYATQSEDGDVRNNGIIGIMAFSEKWKRPVYTAPLYGGGLLAGGGMWNGHSGIITNSVGHHVGGFANSMAKTKSVGKSVDQLRGMARSASMETKTKGGGIYASGASAAPQASFSANASPSNWESFGSDFQEQGLNHIETQSLGTAFGESTAFATTQVNDFVRGDMVCKMVVYYDNARGLKARGVRIERPSKARYQTKPEAFPGSDTGCNPPPGWRG